MYCCLVGLEFTYLRFWIGCFGCCVAGCASLLALLAIVCVLVVLIGLVRLLCGVFWFFCLYLSGVRLCYVFCVF